MKEAFAPKKLEVIRSPLDLVSPLFTGMKRAAPTDRRVSEAARRLLAGVDSRSDLLLYLEDFTTLQHLTVRDHQKLLGLIGNVRQRIFEVVSKEIPTIMVGQVDFREDPAVKNYSSPARWRPLGGVSPGITDNFSVKDLASLRVKPTVWSGANPFTLHTGLEGVNSPFLAEEHVFCGQERGAGEYSTVTLAPNKSHVPVLGTHFKTIPQKARLCALWGAMQGCEILHRSGFIHRDVKPDNIFWNGLDGQLFDFDFAIPLAAYRKGGGGTPGYSDEPIGDEPDHYKFYKHNDSDVQRDLPARDVFAFGMSLGDVFSKNSDWTTDLIDLYKQGNGPSLNTYVQNTLKYGPPRDLVRDMTHLRRIDRPSLSECINRLGKFAGFEKVTFKT